jgi:hypothetical protein
MELVELSIEEVEQKLLRSEVKVMGWVATIVMGILYLKSV